MYCMLFVCYISKHKIYQSIISIRFLSFTISKRFIIISNRHRYIYIYIFLNTDINFHNFLTNPILLFDNGKHMDNS